MALRLSALVIVLSTLKLCRGALVLPRPPSSPNEINQSSSISISSSSSKLIDPKLYNVKTGNHNSRTNVEKPNTDNYKLLEIELRDGIGSRGVVGGPSDINFGEILREVFRDEELPANIKLPLENRQSFRFHSLQSNNKLHSLNSKMSISDPPPFVDNEKLYYLKQGRIPGDIDRQQTSYEPRSYLKSIGSYNIFDKKYATKSFYRPKKYPGDQNFNAIKNYVPKNSLRDVKNSDDRNSAILRGNNNYNEFLVTYNSNEPAIAEVYTTEHSLPTSSELPKQIPPPPSRVPNQTNFPNTTPVLKYMSRRTDILPHGYAF